MYYLKASEYQARKATDFIVVHCSAWNPITKQQFTGVEDIRAFHVKERGWKDIGYHYVIRRNGAWEMGRPWFSVGAHAEGHNHNSIAICLVGGVDEEGKPADNFTPEQMTSLQRAIYLLKRDHYPTAEVLGHTDFEGVTKACPCFDVKTWWKKSEKLVQKEIRNDRCAE